MYDQMNRVLALGRCRRDLSKLPDVGVDCEGCNLGLVTMDRVEEAALGVGDKEGRVRQSIEKLDVLSLTFILTDTIHFYALAAGLPFLCCPRANIGKAGPKWFQCRLLGRNSYRQNGYCCSRHSDALNKGSSVDHFHSLLPCFVFPTDGCCSTPSPGR